MSCLVLPVRGELGGVLGFVADDQSQSPVKKKNNDVNKAAGNRVEGVALL